MSDWEVRIKEAEADADQMQAAENTAEEHFKALMARSSEEAALKSEEFRSWMEKRRATDSAWGEWAMLMDAKPETSA